MWDLMGLALLLVARQVDSVRGMAYNYKYKHQTPSWQKQEKQRKRARLSTVCKLVHVHESRVAKLKSALDPQVPPQQFGGATVRTLTHADCLTKTYQAHGRCGSASLLPTSVPRLRPQRPPLLSRLSGSTRRKCLTAPTLPCSAA